MALARSAQKHSREEPPVVYAIDNDDKATAVAKQNFELLGNLTGIGSHTVITISTGKFLERGADLKFDVVFVDPPYDLPNNEIEKIMESLLRNGFLKPSSVIRYRTRLKIQAL